MTSEPADFKVRFDPQTDMRWVEADAVIDANGQPNGDKHIAMATNNFLVTYTTRATYYNGIALTEKPVGESHYTVNANVVSQLKARVGDSVHSVFAVVPPAGEDTPNDLGLQLLYDASAIQEVVDR